MVGRSTPTTSVCAIASIPVAVTCSRWLTASAPTSAASWRGEKGETNRQREVEIKNTMSCQEVANSKAVR